jgi:hypothetical protein
LEDSSFLFGERGVGFVFWGRLAQERREFSKVTLSNLFYLSLEVGREKVNMIFALIFPTKLSAFCLSYSEGSVPDSDFNDGNNPRTPALQ